ncbi:MAG: hypothetical protein M3Z96_05515 [Pseudomonadota bacterium]|nr:hypothetical protein [Pseudomonadota bacterium]
MFITALFAGLAEQTDGGVVKGYIAFFGTTFVIYISLLICALILYIFTLVFGAVLGFLVSIWAWLGAIATAVLFPQEVHEKTGKLLALLRA